MLRKTRPENELAAIGVDIASKIHNTGCPGLLESVYEAAFVHEISKGNIEFTRQGEIVVV